MNRKEGHGVVIGLCFRRMRIVMLGLLGNS